MLSCLSFGCELALAWAPSISHELGPASARGFFCIFCIATALRALGRALLAKVGSVFEVFWAAAGGNRTPPLFLAAPGSPISPPIGPLLFSWQPRAPPYPPVGAGTAPAVEVGRFG